jgi:type I protein arginine methyltransferase
LSATLQEHRGYLSDTVRLEQFRRAIALAIRPGDVVVDVGCGFAVLGLMCLKAGAARVYGIDRTDAIDVARETAQRAGFGDRYHCIRDHSFRAVIPEPADVIICDHVGYFGFDYGVIATMGDARRRFLKPGGKVIPGQITLQLAGVSSPDCRRTAEVWSAADMPAEYHWLREYGINSKHTHRYPNSALLTGQADLGVIDLNAENPDHLHYVVELVASGDGALDGFGGWFDCEIVPGVHMTNSPLAISRVERDQVFLAFDRPLEVKAGDTIRAAISLRHDVGTIAWTAQNSRTGERRKQSTWRSQILSEADLAPPVDRSAQLSQIGQARQLILSYIDGARTRKEIEQAILRDHPGLLPSEAELRSFIQSELARSTR